MNARNARLGLLGGAIASVVAAASSPARADETWGASPVAAPTEPAPVAVAQQASASPSPHADRARATHWYGWQPILADGLTLTFFTATAFNERSGDRSGVLLAGVGSYLLVPPIIHLAHARPGVAAASLGLRVGVPVGGALLGGVAASGCGDGFCGLAGAVLGFVVGIVAASAIDAGALSNEKVDDGTTSESASGAAPPRARQPAPRAIALTPVGGPRREGGFDIGLGGAF